MNSKKLLEAFTYVDETYLEQADQPAHNRLKLRKRMGLLIAAVICISLLAATAIAALPSVFPYLKQMDPANTPLYEAAEQANLGQEPEPVALPQMKEASLIVNEKYYNGETILLGLNLKAVEGEPAIGYEPDADLMKQIRCFGFVGSAYIFPEERAGITYPRYAGAMAVTLRNILTPEQYAQVEDCMEKTGHCCVVIRSVSVGDHIYVNGNDMCATFDMDMDFYGSPNQDITPGTEAIRLDPLDDSGKNQEQVTVELKINSGLNYYYMDAQGHAYEYYGRSDSVKAEITIPNSEMQ